jgi:hypothetical protein
MTDNRCIHGLDSRFCAACNKKSMAHRPRGAIGSVDLPEILRFLNEEQVRVTYGAVGEVLGVIPRAMGARLGPHTRERSWIVSADTGLSTGYRQDDMHPSLFRASEIISSGTELVMRMTSWKTRQDKSG